MKLFTRLALCVVTIGSACVLQASAIAAPQKSGSKSSKHDAIAWEFKTIEKGGLPHTQISVKIGSKKTLVIKDAVAKFHVLAHDEFKDHKVPSTAMSACSGWWAGQGMDLYAKQSGSTIVVYKSDTQEEGPGPGFKRVKSISAH